MPQLSILNLFPVREGQTTAQAIESGIRLAKLAEKLNYRRYWIAEHHNMPHLASSATQLLIQHVLAHTGTLCVGSGGVMLPNHSPLMVAEQYGTLATLYPNRVELGLGRAPGTDQPTARALRRHMSLANAHSFPNDIQELRYYLSNSEEASSGSVRAYPAAGTGVPLYILGSSTESAYLAAELGLPYAFAAHFAPRLMQEAITIYRDRFQPSSQLAEPYVILGINAIVANSDEQAQHLATTQTQFFLNVVSGRSQAMQPPLSSEEEVWQQRQQQTAQTKHHFGPVDLSVLPIANHERAMVEQMTACTLIGSVQTVRFQWQQLQQRMPHVDELMAVSYIYDEALQHHSYQLLKQTMDS